MGVPLVTLCFQQLMEALTRRTENITRSAYLYCKREDNVEIVLKMGRFDPNRMCSLSKKLWHVPCFKK